MPATPSMPADAPRLQREFRAVWVATVANIDWPSKPDLTTEQQQAEMKAMLDMAAKLNLNAIVLQVRPTADAIYPSTLEPWSAFVTGAQGRAPSPAYDPLEMWIRGAHERGMELHAWFNPFRARHPKSIGEDAANHVSRSAAELVRTHNGYLWLDPGERGAQDHSVAVILDAVSRYDLDGVHFDDYFYPYPKEGEPFPDAATYEKYKAGGGTLELSPWRRENIDRFMKRVYDEVKARKPHVKVGISPFGIWRPANPPGIQGFDAFEKLHADSRRWLTEGWCDYMSPQLYWRRDSKGQPFDPLLRWWLSQNLRGKQVWPGIYTSRIGQVGSGGQGGAGGSTAYDPAEIVGQVELTRKTVREVSAEMISPVLPGVIHFSAVALMQNRQGVADQLRSGPYAQPALVPPTGGPTAAPGTPTAQLASAATSTTVQWTPAAPPGAANSGTSPTAAADAGPGPWIVQYKTKDGTWTTRIVGGVLRSLTIDLPKDKLELVAVIPSSRFGAVGKPAVIKP